MLQRHQTDSVTVSILSRRAGELQNAGRSVTHHSVTGQQLKQAGLHNGGCPLHHCPHAAVRNDCHTLRVSRNG